MSQRQYDKVDTIGGFITVTLGLVASYISLGYSMGSAVAIGPGVFPLLLGVLLILLGIGILVSAQGRASVEVPHLNLRAIVCVLAGITTFGLLIGSAGLLPAILACVIFSRLAESTSRIMPLIVLGLSLSALCWLIFVFALGLPLRILEWPF
jgi:hypothetical protein